MESDPSYLMRLRSGEEDALEHLLEAHWLRLVSYARRMLGAGAGEDEAEDLVQDAYVRLWEGRRRWTARGSAAALLHRIVRNLALNERRRTSHRERLRSRVIDSRKVATPLEECEAAELQSTLASAIHGLAPRRREIFELSRFQGLTYREIAETLDISPQTVANQLSAALDDLGQTVAPYAQEPQTPGDASAGRLHIVP